MTVYLESILIFGRAILSQSEDHKPFLSLLPKHSGKREPPIFQEPWQAKVFALTVELYSKGQFSWRDWTTMLSEELNDRSKTFGTAKESSCYDHWLRALEKLVLERGIADRISLDKRKEAWADAYRKTPHGRAVVL